MKSYTCTSLLPQRQKESVTKTPPISVSYGNWLNTMPWDYYCTFTTRYQLSKPAARRSMARLQDIIKRQYMDIPEIFWVAEPFDSKYGCHLHALVKITGKTPQTITHLKNAWQIASKGRGLKEYNNTTIKDYDPQKGGHFYVAKYLQRHNADYDFYL